MKLEVVRKVTLSLIIMKHIFSSIFALLLITLASQHFCIAQNPVMSWDFETVKNRVAIEESTNIADTIEGNFEIPEGMSGKGLRLDGFTTRVVRKEKDIQKPGSEFTIEA